MALNIDKIREDINNKTKKMLESEYSSFNIISDNFFKIGLPLNILMHKFYQIDIEKYKEYMSCFIFSDILANTDNIEKAEKLFNEISIIFKNKLEVFKQFEK